MVKRVWIGCVAIFLSAMGVAWFVNPGVNVGFQDQASVIAFVTLMSVSIERSIEMVWTVVGSSRLGGSWPLAAIRKQADELEAKTNTMIGATFESAREMLETAKTYREKAGKGIEEVEARLNDLEPLRKRLAGRLAEARKLAPGSTRIAFASDVAADAQAFLAGAVRVSTGFAEKTKEALDTGADAINLATGIIASFEDNPARRIASLFLGTSLGMIGAGVLGLNLFVAILTPATVQAAAGQASAATIPGPLAGVWGIILTGIVIGLGSNPTHEVIKALQNYKKSRQSTTFAAVTEDEAVDEASTRVQRLPGRPADEGYSPALEIMRFDTTRLEPFEKVVAPIETTTRSTNIRRKAFVRLRSTD